MTVKSINSVRPWVYNTEDKEYIAEVLKSFEELDSNKFESLFLKAINSGVSGPFAGADDPLFWLLYNINNNYFSFDGKVLRTDDKIITLLEVLSTHSEKVSNLSKNQAFFMLESIIPTDVFKKVFSAGGVLKPECLSLDLCREYKNYLFLAFELKRDCKFLDPDILTQTISLFDKDIGYPSELKQRARGLTPSKFIEFVRGNDRQLIKEFIVEKPYDLFTSDALTDAVTLNLYPENYHDLYSSILHSIKIESELAFAGLSKKFITPKNVIEKLGDGENLRYLLKYSKDHDFSNTQIRMINRLIETSAKAISTFAAPEKFIDLIYKSDVSATERIQFSNYNLFENGNVLGLLESGIWPTRLNIDLVIDKVVRNQDYKSFEVLKANIKKVIGYDDENAQTFLWKITSNLRKASATNNFDDSQIEMINSLDQLFEVTSTEEESKLVWVDAFKKTNEALNKLFIALEEGNLDCANSSIQILKEDVNVMNSPGILMMFSDTNRIARSIVLNGELTEDQKQVFGLIKDLALESVSATYESVFEIKPLDKRSDHRRDMDSFTL
jgi:hypothetical protein